MRASIHYVNGWEAALVKLGYYDRGYDPYGGLSDSIYQHGHTMRDQQRLEMEDKDHRARAFAGKAMRNPGELEALQQKLTQNEIDESRAAHGVAGGFLGGSLGALGGAALGAAIRPHGPAAALGMLGGAALGGYGGYRLMEPMGQEAGQASADEILDLAHTHGLQNIPKPGGDAAKLAFMGLDPNAMKHIGLRAAGGAAGGAAAGALAGGENNRMSGALAGGAMGGLAAGALSLNTKTKFRDASLGTGAMRGTASPGTSFTPEMLDAMVAEQPARIAAGITGMGAARTAGGGALAGAIPGAAAGRMMHEDQPKLAFTKSTHKELLP